MREAGQNFSEKASLNLDLKVCLGWVLGEIGNCGFLIRTVRERYRVGVFGIPLCKYSWLGPQSVRKRLAAGTQVGKVGTRLQMTSNAVL